MPMPTGRYSVPVRLYRTQHGNPVHNLGDKPVLVCYLKERVNGLDGATEVKEDNAPSVTSRASANALI